MKFEQLHHPSSPPDDDRAPPKTVIEIPGRIHLEGLRKQALDTGRNRLLVTGVLFIFAFAGIAGRLVELALLTDGGTSQRIRVAHTAEMSKVRADIIDRNGILLATSLPTAALYANPRHVLDAGVAARKLARVLPEADAIKLEKKLTSKGTFVWLKRNLTPKLQFQVNALGIPGVYFQKTERRVYPHGKLLSHVLGLTNIDTIPKNCCRYLH